MQIGQGTYSTVFRARDITNNEIVALKKVKFVNMDPESVRFMAREICILRRLDHPNVLKLKAMAISRISGSLSLVFNYMEHDLSGLATVHGAKFTEPQVSVVFNLSLNIVLTTSLKVLKLCIHRSKVRRHYFR